MQVSRARGRLSLQNTDRAKLFLPAILGLRILCEGIVAAAA
jgi:hypothetical protein